MKRQLALALLFELSLFGPVSGISRAAAQTSPALSAPAQDRGIPYTRSTQAAALERLKGGVAVFAGSRYGYVKGYRVRLDETDLLHAEAVGRNGTVYVPASFAALICLDSITTPPPVPADLTPIADRWVYSPHELAPGKTVAGQFKAPAGVSTITVKGKNYYSVADLARGKGLAVTQNPRGLIYIGPKPLALGASDAVLLDSMIALFDTPDKFADPSIAARYIPKLTRQGQWTDHVKVTPSQIALLNGPETEWPTAPKADYDFSGFNAKLLGSKVPPAGVYPRLLFSPEDLPALAARIRNTRTGQKSLIEMQSLFEHSWWDSKTSDGKVFQKLVSGDLAGLEWDVAPGTPLQNVPHIFKGQKAGIYSSHVAYVPECLTAMAFYSLIAGDEVHGRQAAAAIANYYRLREKLLDRYLAVSDSEFSSSYVDERGGLVNMDGNGARTHWRNIHGLVAHMDLPFALDFAGKWMTDAEKGVMRRVIAKSTYGRRSYGQDGPTRFRDINWMAWDLPHFLAVAAIEGLPGFDPEGYASGAESVRAYCDWGMDNAGVIYESNGKTGGALQFHLLSMVTLARRGENLFGHPHWRRLLEGQIQMTSPSGRVTVNSGTQYVPYSRQALSQNYVTEIKGFFPASRLADYLITKSISEPGAAQDEFLRSWPRESFDPKTYEKEVTALKRLRLPSPTYPGFVNAVLYDGDITPTTRADLKLPLDFSDPVHGVFSSYSDSGTDAAWMNMMVRPDHYLGGGHHHADAGMFHFSALGVDWFTQSPFPQVYDGNYYNLAQVDGRSEPTSVPREDGALLGYGILGYGGAAKYLGGATGPQGAIGSADLTYAYSWRWLTQPPETWTKALTSMGWEMDPSPEIARMFAGTARYKMRFWWPTYTYSNYIATSRAPYNPMQFVFRSTGLVRGRQSYGIVVDDLKKDEASHEYQWVAMLNGGVWKADVKGLAPGQMALAYRAGDPPLSSSETVSPIAVHKGEPLLLVCAISGAERGMPIAVQRMQGPEARDGKAQSYNRLTISTRGKAASFKVLMLPVRAGEPLPIVTYDAKANVAKVRWPGQTDELKFATAEDHRTRVTVLRDNAVVLESR